jgi:type VI secretion system secreted protein VgrG
MATYLQADRPIAVFTPLPPDALLLTGVHGEEGLSRPFHFQLDVVAEDPQKVAFDKLLGNRVTVRLKLADDRERFWSGICSHVSEVGRDIVFTHYRLELVPQLWLLTRRAQSRIFQDVSVPDILKKVLSGVDVTFEIQGKFEPRDYCVQYRETDFNFASRLMEEEGIYYFFKHTRNSHTMVVANTPQSHPDLPLGSRIIFDETAKGREDDLRVVSWQKSQSLRSGKVTLWDHCFELPHKHLEAEEMIQDSVVAGKVTHKLKVGNNDQLELYDFPGEYAQRFDGVDRGGGDRPADVQKIFQDNGRTAKIRIQEEAAAGGLLISGSGVSRNFVSGHKFTLERHYHADGAYVLTGVTHGIAMGTADYRAGQDGDFEYSNTFACIPSALPFRPPRVTPKPIVSGPQTAVVVGPPGEEIFPDKYGRVKVQFHWDREGKSDAESSCWLRVAQSIAGKRWGSIFIPRIGQEVLVAFEEGDPDRPIIVGSLFNARQMPPYTLPKHKTRTVLFKSNSTTSGGGHNEIRFEDDKGKEQIYIHGEKDVDIRIKDALREKVGGDRHLLVDGTQNEQVGKDWFQKTANKIVIESGMELTIKSSGGFIKIDPSGVTIVGTMVLINSGGAAGVITKPPDEARSEAQPGSESDPGASDP